MAEKDKVRVDGIHYQKKVALRSTFIYILEAKRRMKEWQRDLKERE